MEPGKRGGVRVNYFYHNDELPVYLLMVYSKTRRENLSSDEKQMVRRLAMRLRENLR